MGLHLLSTVRWTCPSVSRRPSTPWTSSSSSRPRRNMRAFPRSAAARGRCTSHCAGLAAAGRPLPWPVPPACPELRCSAALTRGRSPRRRRAPAVPLSRLRPALCSLLQRPLLAQGLDARHAARRQPPSAAHIWAFGPTARTAIHTSATAEPGRPTGLRAHQIPGRDQPHPARAVSRDQAPRRWPARPRRAATGRRPPGR